VIVIMGDLILATGRSQIAEQTVCKRQPTLSLVGYTWMTGACFSSLPLLSCSIFRLILFLARMTLE
jgi:hypothetical protein